MDNYLIYLTQSYSYDALYLLVDKYQKLLPLWIKEVINTLDYKKAYDEQVLLNDLIILIYKTIESYEASKGVFYSYLKGAVHNVILNHLRANRNINSYALSLSTEIDENIYLIDTISSSSNIAKIKERFYVLEEVEDIMTQLNKMKKDEKQIIYLRMQGYSNDEIVRMIDTSIRKVNYTVRKVKKL